MVRRGYLDTTQVARVALTWEPYLSPWLGVVAGLAGQGAVSSSQITACLLSLKPLTKEWGGREEVVAPPGQTGAELCQTEGTEDCLPEL
jgi:hypothetical protein